MSALDPLAPDQRAVVSLVLQQGRSYDEIASLLGMPVDAVRARAQAGLAALAHDNGLPPEVTGPVADYLLGQQSEGDADATRGLLADSEPARAWAADVAARLEGVAPGRLAEIPAAGPRDAAEPTAAAGPPDAAEPTAAAGRVRPAESTAAAQPPGPRPRPVREAPAAAEPPGPRPRPVREAADADDDAPPAASRLGGALLILGVLAVVAVVLFLVLRGGGDDPAGEEAAASPAPTATATATPSAAQPEPAATIRLRPPGGGGDATGTMSLFLQEGQLLFALEAENVPASKPGAAYAVWFTGPGAKARRLGFTNPVGEDGRLGIQGPSDKDLEAFPQLYATYQRVVVSEETNENAKRPGKVILAGRLPQGR